MSNYNDDIPDSFYDEDDEQEDETGPFGDDIYEDDHE